MAKRSASAIVNDPSFWESGDDESIDRDSDVEDADFIIPIDENSSDSDNDSTADFDSSTSRPGSKPDGHDDVNFAVGILTENASENEIDETEYEVEVNRDFLSSALISCIRNAYNLPGYKKGGYCSQGIRRKMSHMSDLFKETPSTTYSLSEVEEQPREQSGSPGDITAYWCIIDKENT
ncbi:hypothetical protein LOTGIDRAFT_159777 [Lottia gigantea]|uniref:Uncharacterized protein n=1 Tax=Lottia gigantea TaxID=225164 RepID=V4ATG4_LOTGI|nr:hypothetical protein LOTGIDRAFT_159777 [Lottia gigantea]ESO97026.1 hypothetical protein LOTGIDRAFT_159777 [Lottia gigantea]